MAKEKSPAFQFYTKDWDSDINVIPMTYEEEGVYFAVIRLLWNHRNVPSDLDHLRLLLKGKPSLSRMKKWWKKIGRCFIDRNSCLFHKRVERERRKQAAYRKSQSDKGKKGGRPKATEKPELSSGKALHLQSASSPSGLDHPLPPKGGSRRRGNQHLRAVIGSNRDRDAVDQAMQTRERRSALLAAGMSEVDVEATLERESIERKAATA